MRLERVESDIEDEKQVEKKDQESLTRKSTSPPLESVFPSTSYPVPSTVVDFVSSPAFNLPPCLPTINEKSALFNPPSLSNIKAKVRIEAIPIVFHAADFPHPIGSNHGDYSWTNSGTALGIGQLKLEGLGRYSNGQNPSV